MTSPTETAVEEGEISESPDQIRPSQVIKESNVGILTADQLDSGSHRTSYNSSILTSSIPIVIPATNKHGFPDNNQLLTNNEPPAANTNLFGSSNVNRPNFLHNSFNKANGRGSSSNRSQGIVIKYKIIKYFK